MVPETPLTRHLHLVVWPPRTKPLATLVLELAKIASLAIAPAAAVLYGFAWFVRSVQDPLWVLIALFVMTLSVGIAIFLVLIWCDRE
ncbi:hypothetical protein BOSEA1005_30806 [Hyphomicrobiales bacterium]|nr:hypothetical protein BOSEA1005_30806 [Hyphomicrobiales bacterium]CAI0347119.1 hypothetical protein BO1005MUT1_530295 [Hyphomicrobiales bacterium]